MAQPYIGEIRMFAGNFAPAGWALCNGQVVAIADNDTLFQLIGTTYGGDGQSTFALPDLRGRVPVHMGSGPTGTTYVLAEQGGVESVTLTTGQMPSHAHPLLASQSIATTANAANNLPGQAPAYTPYISGFAPNVALAAASVSVAGGSQPHANLQPYLCINFIISLFGIFPSQT